MTTFILEIYLTKKNSIFNNYLLARHLEKKIRILSLGSTTQGL
jgi:hypothetical protein